MPGKKQNLDIFSSNTASIFESIRYQDESGAEYWKSRELAEALGYEDYRNFISVLEKAKIACKKSKIDTKNHFVDVNEMVTLGSGAQREIGVTLLSRYACYLIVQNADPRKKTVAYGQTYFALQTRRQELAEEQLEAQQEDERRLFLRGELRHHNAQLADTARGAGVVQPMDYAIFQNHGYMGLYGGLKENDIHKRKGLKKSQKILDHMGSTELAANLFRATQTEDKLRRENIKGKTAANTTHYEVGVKVRQTIQELGGTMPEELPVAESIKKTENKRHKLAPSTNPALEE